MTHLEVIAIEKRYSDSSLVGPVSFDMGQGEFVSLLGPSGCGKTTTLRCIAGFESPSAGDIRLGGQSILSLPANKRGIGLVFQRYALFPHLSAFENVAFGLRLLRKQPEIDLTRRVSEMLEIVGLHDFGNRLPGQMSGGQQQRVALARSLVLEPSVLLLDEPLSNLDARLRVQMRAEIRRLQREFAMTTIYVTHDQSEALALSDRIVVMNKGTVCQIASPRVLYEEPTNVFVADFIGSSNILECESHAVEGGSTLVSCRGLKLRRTPRGSTPADSSGRVSAVIRPERIKLVKSGDDRASNEVNCLQGLVSEVVYLGDVVHAKLDLGQGTTLLVVVGADDRVQPQQGDVLTALIAPSDVHLISSDEEAHAAF